MQLATLGALSTLLSGCGLRPSPPQHVAALSPTAPPTSAPTATRTATHTSTATATATATQTATATATSTPTPTGTATPKATATPTDTPSPTPTPTGTPTLAPDPELELMLGQMLLVGFRGLAVEDQHPIVADLRDRHLGGVVLFDRDGPARSATRSCSRARWTAPSTSRSPCSAAEKRTFSRAVSAS